MIIDNKYSITIVISFFVAVQLFAQERKMVVITDDSFTPHPQIEAQTEKERQDSIDVIDKKWSEYFNETNIKLDNLYTKLSSIDSDTASKVAKYKKELEHIQRKFNERDCRDRLLENKSIENQYDTYAEKIGDIELKMEELLIPPPPKEVNWLVIGIAAGVLIMGGLPILMQIASKRSARKQQKEAEWQSITTQYLQLPQDLNVACVPLIETLIVQCTNFLEKRPKRMHKDAARERIEELKIKKLKCNKTITI
jgi:hypothetical protein